MEDAVFALAHAIARSVRKQVGCGVGQRREQIFRLIRIEPEFV